MSASEGSLGSGSPGSSAAPPSAPAAAPPVATPPPAAAPVAPATPAVAQPAVETPGDAVAPSATPGAIPPKPATLDAAKELYRQEKERIAAGEAAQQAAPGEIAPPAEAKPIPEPAAPVEAPPAEPVVEEPVQAAPEAEEPAPTPAESTFDDSEYKERAMTADEVRSRFSRKLSKAEIEVVSNLEAHRGELITTIDKFGGDLGVKIGTVINQALLKDDPTDADVDAVIDAMVLPEGANAVEFWDKMGKRLVNTQLQEESCGSCKVDGNKPNPQCTDHISMGREFGSQMIQEEYATNEDGTAFDFWGMKPIEFVDTLIKAVKFKDTDGNTLIGKEFILNELAANKKPEPSARELELQRENEELRAKTRTDREAGETEQKRKDEQAKVTYKTQATGYVARQLNAVILPLATNANWIAVEGETGPQVEQRKNWGRMLTNDIHTSVLGTVNKPTPEYQAVLDMIENGTAFDAQGIPTGRFDLKLKPLRTMAKAKFREAERVMGSLFKFAASNSRAAKLVKEVGGKVGEPAEEAPPLAVAPPPSDPNRKKSSHELIEEERIRFRAKVAAEQQRQTAGVLR